MGRSALVRHSSAGTALVAGYCLASDNAAVQYVLLLQSPGLTQQEGSWWRAASSCSSMLQLPVRLSPVRRQAGSWGLGYCWHRVFAHSYSCAAIAGQQAKHAFVVGMVAWRC